MTFITVTLTRISRQVPGLIGTTFASSPTHILASGASQMSNFVLFHVYLILTITSLIVSTWSLFRWNSDMLGAMVILFFLSIIGLSCNYAGFVREFCGRYGIVISG